MDTESKIKTANYPDAPWTSQGKMWFGIFKTQTPFDLPDDLIGVLNSHLVIVSIIRYLKAAIIYDELIIGRMARHGRKLGVYVNHIWVDHYDSLMGGREIWGLEKQMAQFEWSDSSVHISDDRGSLLTAHFDRDSKFFLPGWVPTPGFGFLNDKWTYFYADFTGKFSKPGMTLTEWSDRFSPLTKPNPVFGYYSPSFNMKINAPSFFSTNGTH
jgi:hypothetical protein